MDIKIDNHAGKLAVIGSPIEHSLSPLMHNYMAQYLSSNYIYLPYNIKKGAFKNFLESAKLLNITGFNCTMPHKEDAFKCVDKIFGDAKQSKSVNTVNLSNNEWHGYSTDGDGFNLSLKEIGITFENKKVLIIGSGGAGKALTITALKNNASQITILSRTLNEPLQKNISNRILNFESLKANFLNSDIIINCTPLGMDGIKNDFENLNFISKGNKVVCDLIYNPIQTNFLKIAKEKGHLTINGLPMLIYQGILSFEIFTGTKIDYLEMKKELMKVLCVK